MLTKQKTYTADIKLRVPEVLRRRIEDAARGNGASMNSEMIGRLERSFASDAPTDPIEKLAAIKAILAS